ncbi:hypothetical protein UlMin_005502 [Ulmus minor]
MSEPQPKTRPAGGTEFSWCSAVPTGTGITVLALLISKPPNISNLQNAVRRLQASHPILNSNLHFDSAANAFSFLTPSYPRVEMQPFDLQSTAQIIRSGNSDVSPFHLVLEHELNRNSWSNPSHPSYADADVLFASLYDLSETEWALVLRLHTSACDRTAAVALLKGLLREIGGGEGGGVDLGLGESEEVSLGIEELIPSGKANKPFWARGVDLLGYSLNSFRLANLEFKDSSSTRHSQVVRLRISTEETERLVSDCKSRGIKLSGALAAAALMAARSTKNLPLDQREKYGVVTLTDCRLLLEPPLSSQHLGFYHSAILNTHDISGEETIWELATRTYMSFAKAKESNKHFSDMSDLNYLMCKAIENPGLTPSSSMRTAFISVFEDPVIDDSNELKQEFGLEDYVGCSSVHGVGPSIAIFDTIRQGGLDCACVYPSPLHSREQMQELIDNMKRILADGCTRTIIENGS